jgi:ubiquinone/menaquinone biosynthesis C-methylase UbiE
MDALLASREIELIETDVGFGERTMLVCDAHDLPFIDNSFDGVVIQAVLEHVVDPFRCVEEIHRVLKADGLVYAETPFMQQVHLGPYDFTRFTHLGHRRLFRRFDEIDSGPVAGPGTVLGWSYEHFLLSFVSGTMPRLLVKVFARLTGSWLKYLDKLVEGRPGALDAASGYYFLGRKSEHTLHDRELIKLYRGAQAS